MSNFKDTAQTWLATPVPSGSSIDDLDEVHADLALADTWVAESVLPYLRANEWSPATPDVLAALDQLIAEANRLRSNGDDDNGLATEYISYAQLLQRLYGAFLEEANERMDQ